MSARRVRLLTFPAVVLFMVAGCSVASKRHQQIRTTLERQAAAWNRGDIDAYMDGYVRGDALTFSSGGETHRGWDQTRERYAKRYPTPEAMGELTFSELETQFLGERHALSLGRWHLRRESGDIGGNFSLVWRRASGVWRILHDHTSLAEPSSGQ